MNEPVDDLGTPVPIRRPARRIVSLVPSITESLTSVDAGAIVGATDWCTHPADLRTTRIRGTKNPDIRAIIELDPDLVLANMEENRRIDVDRLRAANIPVWVTDIRSLDAALTSLGRMFTHALGWEAPAWLAHTRAAWAQPAPQPRRRATIAIWRDPWMVVGRDTFTDDLANRLGLHNCYADAADRYPHTTVEEIIARAPEVVLLPDEPYPFSRDDGPEAFPDTHVALPEGRLLTWYGPSLLTARGQLLQTIRSRP